MNRRFRIAFIATIVAASLLGGVLTTVSKHRHAKPGPNREAIEAGNVADDFVAAFDTVTSNYAGQVDYERATQTAIQGMLSTLDPHSLYFPRSEFTRLQQDQDSRFYGIGVSILQHHDGVYVQNTVPDTPAARAGLRYGDRIIEVDGEDARDWTSEQVSKRVRGDLGEPVRLKVERAGSTAPLNFTIVRASVPLPSIRDYFMLRPGTGYIGLTGGFQNTTDEELREAIANLNKQGMHQVVLDLRGNPGGLLPQAIDVASEFIDRGKVIVSVRGRKEYSDPYVWRSKGSNNEDFPLVILINRNTASASEIVAGAVQDHGRGLIVGETSFGKGLVQRIFPLLFGTGITLTTAHYYTPYGRLIQRDYSSGSFYDYYVRHDTEEKPASDKEGKALPSATPPPGPAVRTAGGRVFYGGGGITPDIEVKAPQLTPERQRIMEAGFFFTRLLAAGQIPGLESYKIEKTDLRHELKSTDYPVTERLLDAFRAYAQRDATAQLTSAQIDANLDFVKQRLRMEVVNAAFGGDAAQRVFVENDVEVVRSLEALPDAKRLAEASRNEGQIG
jgi:carboxyl-terminal processing protease